MDETEVDIDRVMHWYLSNHRTEGAIGTEERGQYRARWSQLEASASQDSVAADNMLRCGRRGCVYMFKSLDPHILM
jgi:hypothetical protein